LLQNADRATLSEERHKTFSELAKDIGELSAKRVALGNAVNQVIEGRDALVKGGDKLAADVQRFTGVTRGTSFSQSADALASSVLLVRIASWRFLAVRDQSGIGTFKYEVSVAQQLIEGMERSELPPNLVALLKLIKSGVTDYAASFTRTAENLIVGDDLYYKDVTPLTVSAVKKIESAEDSLGAELQATKSRTDGKIVSTILTQGIVAGLAFVLGALLAYFVARGIMTARISSSAAPISAVASATAPLNASPWNWGRAASGRSSPRWSARSKPSAGPASTVPCAISRTRVLGLPTSVLVRRIWILSYAGSCWPSRQA
jgi:hypothetical protein